MSKFGFSSINDSTSTKNKSNLTFQDMLLGKKVFFGRVVSIILDDTHPRYTELGGPKSIGIVEFVDYKQTPRDTETTNGGTYLRYARPLLQNQKNIPILNEIITLTTGPSYDIQTNTSERTLYYVDIVNIWGHPHHNSLPFLAGTAAPTQNQSIINSEIIPNKLLTTAPLLNLGPGFIERVNINPLNPNLGDMILEGRWGNTLRFTNSTGSAVTILRNGQGEIPTGNQFDLIYENINKDSSSIYLLENSRTELNPASTNDYFSYKSNNKPESINTFIGSQLILNSGRLVFNSKYDHILLTSAKSININARESINLETTGETVVASGTIYLGSQNATEPLLLGNTAVELLDQFANILEHLLSSATKSTTPAGPVEPLRTDAQRLLLNLKNIKQEFSKMKSTRNFTI